MTSGGGALEGLLKAREERLIGHLGDHQPQPGCLARAVEDGLFEERMTCSASGAQGLGNRDSHGARQGHRRDRHEALFRGHSRCAGAAKYALLAEGTVVRPGVENPEIFDENWEIFMGDWTLDRGEQRQIEEIRSMVDKQFYRQPCPEKVRSSI